MPNSQTPKTCTAIVHPGRWIQLMIDKSTDGYQEFADALKAASAQGFTLWYGDVRAADGSESYGLKLMPLCGDSDALPLYNRP